MPDRLPVSPAIVVLSLLTLPVRGADDPQALAFFEQKVRPALVAHCTKCHSTEAEAAQKLRGGLYLDTRDGWLKGGDSGPAIVPHKPEESLFIKALKYDGDLRMPPKGKLPDVVIADLEKWVAMGAPDPRRAQTATRRQVGMSIEEGRRFWAYRRPMQPPVPVVKNTSWPLSDADRFVLARLEAAGLTPAPDADRRTFARRLYFDLLGLPAAPEEVDAFVNDTHPEAVEHLVDRLLGSEAFGERWGRHWLDVARYAESVTLRGFVFKEGWRYRDYVIDAFNRDLPFDRFIREQLAGDLLPADNIDAKQRQIVATGFLLLGNTNLEEQDKKQLRMDVVDEQLDVIAKGFLGQTVTCARCHDHKFDPIPTKDYYALAGILRNAKVMEHANVSAWTQVPLPIDPALEATYTKQEQQLAALRERIKAEKARSARATSDTGAAGSATAKGILRVEDVPGVVVDDAQAKKVGTWQDSTFSGIYIGTGYTHDQNAGKGEKTLTFDPDLPATGRYEVRLAYAPGKGRATNVPVTVFSADGEKTIAVNMQPTPPIEGRFLSLGTYRFEKDGQSFVIVSNEETNGHVTADAVTFIPEGTTAVVKSATPAAPGTAPSASLKALEEELARLQAAGAARPMAMAPLEEKAIEDAKVHVRGSVHNLGELAPRGFLQVATLGTPPVPSKEQSGRKELADWIASADNPLTARVIVNRAWHWLFGTGLVRTVDNFGTTGELPSHPELLDLLATQFVRDGWSMKKLIRTLVLSRTYRQATTGDRKGLAADPENRLFGRANRRRLDAECIRDAMLVVSGQLSHQRGGRTFPATLASDYTYKAADTRRSVYLPMFRNAMPDLLEAFDMADPSLVTGKRNTSTVAPQALFLLNNPFVIEQSKHAAARLLESELPDDARLVRAYRLCLGREPTPGERQAALKYVSSAADRKGAWEGLVHALFASADFRFVD